MSRGFDGFEIDEFRDSGFDSGRDAGRGSSSDWNGRTNLHNIHRQEDRADSLGREAQKHSGRERPPLAREERVKEILSQPNRTRYTDRDRNYSLRDSETHSLSEVGKFRVVATNDLTEFAYHNDRSRIENDLLNLVRQGLIEQRGTSVLKKDSRQVLTLTKQGQRLIRRQGFVPEDQAIYHGFVKPKEAHHDADLYRLYHKAADEIERKGGKVLRVALDYELKEKLYKKLGEAQARKDKNPDRGKGEFARELHLPVVQGKVAFPDMRIEYETQEGERARVDLELATGHYHGQHLAEKARAGFQIYARPQDAAGLRRIRDEREITTAILSF
ncbi:MAG TPA: hypothetical protein VJP02_10205 [Candidatus Sulfotelmatobacter sp.]|nr:hypothetical protein [Candidatus Sulfotelmatobacter sp.]